MYLKLIILKGFKDWLMILQYIHTFCFEKRTKYKVVMHYNL